MSYEVSSKCILRIFDNGWKTCLTNFQEFGNILWNADTLYRNGWETLNKYNKQLSNNLAHMIERKHHIHYNGAEFIKLVWWLVSLVLTVSALEVSDSCSHSVLPYPYVATPEWRASFPSVSYILCRLRTIDANLISMSVPSLAVARRIKLYWCIDCPSYGSWKNSISLKCCITAVRYL